jgi:hypothetical protein
MIVPLSSSFAAMAQDPLRLVAVVVLGVILSAIAACVIIYHMLD